MQGIASVVVSSALGVDTQKSISIRIAPGQANGGANIVFRLVNEAMSLFRQVSPSPQRVCRAIAASRH